MYLYIWEVILKAPFILAVTESWLSPEDIISLMFLKGYSVFLTCIPGAISLGLRWVIFLYLSHFYIIFLILPQRSPVLKLIPSDYTIGHPLGCSYLQNSESHSPFCEDLGPCLTATLSNIMLSPSLVASINIHTVDPTIPSPFHSKTSFPPVSTSIIPFQPPTLCS